MFSSSQQQSDNGDAGEWKVCTSWKKDRSNTGQRRTAWCERTNEVIFTCILPVHLLSQESLDDAKVSVRQPCVYEGPLAKKSAVSQRYAISYWWFIVPVAVLLTVCEIFSSIEVENCHFRALYSDCRPIAEERLAISTSSIDRWKKII